jgi:protein phosphatase
MSPNVDSDTAAIKSQQDATLVIKRRIPSALVQVDVAGLTHTGEVRPNNEDHFLIGRYGRFLETLQTNVPATDIAARTEEIGYGMVVADGIGGAAAGEFASQLAVSTLVKLFLETPDWIMRIDDQGFADEVMWRAKERLEQVNATLATYAENDPALHGFGTTLTLAASLGADLFLTNVGDSRAYLLRQDVLYQLTRDHTLAQGLADRGVIAQHEVATHHMHNVLTKALGGRGKIAQPDVRKIILTDGDCLLLCSDGLTRMVADARIQETLAAGQPAIMAAHRLIEQALEAGGKDNVTVIVARYHFPSR